MVEASITEALRATDELLLELDRGDGARELALTKTKLEEAELWLQRSRQRALQAEHSRRPQS